MMAQTLVFSFLLFCSASGYRTLSVQYEGGYEIDVKTASDPLALATEFVHSQPELCGTAEDCAQAVAQLADSVTALQPHLVATEGCPRFVESAQPPFSLNLTVEVDTAGANVHLFAMIDGEHLVHPTVVNGGSDEASLVLIQMTIPPTFNGGVGQHRVEVFCLDSSEWEENFQGRDLVFNQDFRRLAGQCSFECGFTARFIPELTNSSSLLAGPGSMEDARSYVSGHNINAAARKIGLLQPAKLRFIRGQGLQKNHRVLEYGCGTLDLAGLLVPWLGRGAYSCVEPNRWLPLAALSDTGASGTEAIAQLLEQRATFAFREDFRLENIGSLDDAALRGCFDFMYAHSVFSHLGTTQLDGFFAAVSWYLRKPNGSSPGGTGIFSMCLCRSCGPGDRGGGEFLDVSGRCDESGEKFWVYPYVSWFSMLTLRQAAQVHGLQVTWSESTREALNAELGGVHNEWQDWIIVQHQLP